jgi:hypothetical protein
MTQSNRARLVGMTGKTCTIYLVWPNLQGKVYKAPPLSPLESVNRPWQMAKSFRINKMRSKTIY